MAGKLTLFSFFSGSGFLDLGFETNGFEVAYVNEIHRPFQDAYKYSRNLLNLPHAKYGYYSDDVAKLTDDNACHKLAELIADARLTSKVIGFIGGPPCPDFSIGGRNRGRDGDNGKLSGSYIELVCRLQPDFFLFENVKGLWKTQKHRSFYEELKRKVQDAGYITSEKLINSIEYSVPQDRDRIILLGFNLSLFGKDLSGERSISEFVLPWNSYKRYIKKSVLNIAWPKTEPFQIDSEKRKPDEVIEELTVEHWFRRNDVYNHPNAQHFFKPRAGLKRFNSIDEGDDSKKSFKRLHRWRYSPTACYGNNEVHLHPYKARRISVSEALSIQSLPALYSLPPYMSLTDMFKTIGNGVPYLVAVALSNLIAEIFDDEKMTDFLDWTNELKESHFEAVSNQPIQLGLKFS
ncbi:DNA cytosine methyltransferase [Leptolyngbya ohadii]|uniref:DNA cytosine methyltransferase n=1 Tax=Leptolyngbya ohadii TaxID=1962290 RepID=UPI000B5A1738|nr:DNA cytosine methyltransferase [Leptolyngbya ohadii]